MLCPTCQSWCAITEKQLSVRINNISGNPEVQISKCPKCNGVEWATTAAMIRHKQQQPKSRWRRFLDKF